MTGSRLLIAALLLAVAATACTGSDEGAPPANGSPSVGTGGDPDQSRSPEESTAQQPVQNLLEGEEAPPPVASITGELVIDFADPSPVEVDILAVRATAQTTLLRWQLRSGTNDRVRTYTQSLSLRPSTFDTRALSLVDARGNQRVQPFTVAEQSGGDGGCLCSTMPPSVGAKGIPMYALFPPLSPDATTVDVVIPGLPIAEKVPVTR